jgi:hypothetical protein
VQGRWPYVAPLLADLQWSRDKVYNVDPRIILQPKTSSSNFHLLQAPNRWEFCVGSVDGDCGPNRPVFNANLITVITIDRLGVHCPGLPSGLDPSGIWKGDRPPNM